MKVDAVSIVGLLVIVCPTFGAPPVSNKISSLESVKTVEKARDVVNLRHSFRHHRPHGMQELSRSRDVLTKNTYMLLKSLIKVQGQDGRSPVCKICSANFVDAITYDHFCLPESDGMDGAVCDNLTFLGTTTAHQISLACKLVLSRRPIICK